MLVSTESQERLAESIGKCTQRQNFLHPEKPAVLQSSHLKRPKQFKIDNLLKCNESKEGNSVAIDQFI